MPNFNPRAATETKYLSCFLCYLQTTSFCEPYSEKCAPNVISDDFRPFVVLSIYLTECPMSNKSWVRARTLCKFYLRIQ